MQSRWSGSTGLSVQRQLEERGCKRPLRSNSDEATPPENPGYLSSWAERGRRGEGTGAREQAEEGGGFGVPAAANFKPKDDRAAPPAAVELFACACSGPGQLCAQQGLPGSLCRAVVCHPEKQS